MKRIDLTKPELACLIRDRSLSRIRAMEPQPEDGYYRDEYRETRHPIGPVGTKMRLVFGDNDGYLYIGDEPSKSLDLVTLAHTEVRRISHTDPPSNGGPWCWIDTLELAKERS